MRLIRRSLLAMLESTPSNTRVEEEQAIHFIRFAQIQRLVTFATIDCRQRLMGLRVKLIMMQNMRYALRTLARSPGYAAVTILTLALGIGANPAIFSVVTGVLLKPLPYPRSDRLLFITSTFPGLGFVRFWVSVPEWAEFKERNRSFQAVGAYREGSVNLGTPEQPRRVNSALVTPELLDVLGVPPARGRLFNEVDARPGAEDVGIMSYTTWQSDFGRDESVVGRVIQIDGTPTRIVGIMPPAFDIHDDRIEVILPLTIDRKTFPNERSSHFMYL